MEVAEWFMPNTGDSTATLNYKQYLRRERRNEEAHRGQHLEQQRFLQWKLSQIDLARQLPRTATYGMGYQGYGNGTTHVSSNTHDGQQTTIIMPSKRKRPRPQIRELNVSRKAALKQADIEECLVPIRIDIDNERLKLRDTFTLDKNDEIVSLEYFAELTCVDFGLHPAQIYSPLIHRAIAEQITDFYPHPSSSTTLPPMPLEGEQQLPYTAFNDDDMRIVVKLNITLGAMNLVDSFEWDINSPQSEPEYFAERLAADLGLPAEFTTAIAHSIREQSQLYTKSLFLVGHAFDGRIIEDEDMRYSFLPTIFSSIKRENPADGPNVYTVDENETDTSLADAERENRRRRRTIRSRRAGGVQIAEYTDGLKTHRSALIYKGNIPGNVYLSDPSSLNPAIVNALSNPQILYGVNGPSLIVKLRINLPKSFRVPSATPTIHRNTNTASLSRHRSPRPQYQHTPTVESRLRVSSNLDSETEYTSLPVVRIMCYSTAW